MTITEIIALAKQGYKPNDIKELINLSKEAEPETDPQDENVDIVDKNVDKSEDEEKTDNPFLEELEKQKKELEEVSKQLKETQEKLKQAQLNNTKKDNSGKIDEKSNQEKLNELFRDFM